MLGIYVRISRDREGEVSTQDQLKIGKQLAKKLNIKFKLYEDKGISGTLGADDRPALNDLINDIESGKIIKVFAYDQSRLEREPQIRFYLLKLFEEYNIELYYETGLVSNDIEAQAFGTIYSVFNNLQVKISRKKIISVLKYNAENGKVHALPPYAYYKDSNNKVCYK
jgi:site-specific DNA recombinase